MTDRTRIILSWIILAATALGVYYWGHSKEEARKHKEAMAMAYYQYYTATTLWYAFIITDDKPEGK